MIDSNTARLEGYVKDLLHIARHDDAQHTLDRVEVDIVRLAHDTAAAMRTLADQKQLRIQITAEKEILIDVDSEKIQQTLSNLLSNAIKFSENGLIEIRIRRQSQECEVSVTDQGKGIAPADLDRIFDRFFQGQNSQRGSGIGLTIAKAWVEAHGGKIWAESEGEGKGATVTFTLPVI